MKKTYIALTALLLSATMFSCKKNAVLDLSDPIGESAQIRYTNYGTGAPSVNYFANGVKVSVTLSATGTESTTGTAVYPNLSSYSIIAGGTYEVKAQIPSLVAIDGNLAISTLSATLQNGKYYSYFNSGIYNTTAKTIDAFYIEDVLPTPDYTVAYVRLVNCISNTAGGAPLSLYLKNTITLVETLVAPSVAYKSGSVFFAIPSGSYELYARYPSAPTVNVISRNGTSAFAFSQGKIYTIGAKGDMTVTSTTLATRPQLDVNANK